MGIEKFGWRRQLLLSLAELRSDLSARARTLPEVECIQIHSGVGSPVTGTPHDSPRHSAGVDGPVESSAAIAKPASCELRTPTQPQAAGFCGVPPLQLSSRAVTPSPRLLVEASFSPPVSARRAATPAERFAASPLRQRPSTLHHAPTRSGSMTSFRVCSVGAVPRQQPVAAVVASASPAPRISPRVVVRSPSPRAQLGVVRGTIVGSGVSLQRRSVGGCCEGGPVVEVVVAEPVSSGVLRWTSPESPRSLVSSGSSKGLCLSGTATPLAPAPLPPPPQAVVRTAVSPRKLPRASSPPSVPGADGKTCRSARSNSRRSLRPRTLGGS